MRRLAVLALLPVALACGVIASAAAASCPRISATYVRADHGPGARIVACLRRGGRPVTLARGSRFGAPRRARPILGRPAVDGARVVFEALDRTTLRQVVVTARGRRTTLDRRYRTAPSDADADLLAVRAFPDHALAWIVPTPALLGAGPLHLRRPGTATRTIAPAATRTFVEDRTTLGWWTDHEQLDFLDVAPRPRRDGCPVRSRFRRVVLDTPLLRVTAHAPLNAVYRACWKATGADGVVDSPQYDAGVFDPVAFQAAGSHLLVAETEFDHYFTGPGGGLVWLSVVDVATRRRERTGTIDDVPHTTPLLAPTGAVAWTETAADGTTTIQALGPDGHQHVLDSATPPAHVADLALTGDAFTWTHDGAARSVPAT